jgi:hypothetical protein
MVICAASAAWGQSPFEFQQFSGTMITNAAQHPMSMKFYRSASLMRADLPGGGYSVTDINRHSTYMVMGGRCMQMTSPPPQSNPFATAGDAKIERSPAGTETVDGHTCKIENVTVTPKDGKPTKMKMWEAQDLKGFPVKIEMQTERGAVTVLYKDVSFAAPEAALFQHPSDCVQMTMPQGMSPQ